MKNYISSKEVTQKLSKLFVVTCIALLMVIGASYAKTWLTGAINDTANQYNTNYTVSLTK